MPYSMYHACNIQQAEPHHAFRQFSLQVHTVGISSHHSQRHLGDRRHGEEEKKKKEGHLWWTLCLLWDPERNTPTFPILLLTIPPCELLGFSLTFQTPSGEETFAFLPAPCPFWLLCLDGAFPCLPAPSLWEDLFCLLPSLGGRGLPLGLPTFWHYSSFDCSKTWRMQQQKGTSCLCHTHMACLLLGGDLPTMPSLGGGGFVDLNIFVVWSL